MPHVVVLAGPNGAGKSSTAPTLLQGTLRVETYVNADVIAQGRPGPGPRARSLGRAGGIMIQRSDSASVDIGRLMEERTPIDRAVEAAQAETVQRHRRMGLPLVVWRDGRVQWVPADEIHPVGELPGGET